MNDNMQECEKCIFKPFKQFQPERHYDEWCTDCKEYDQEKHCCPRFNHVIRTTLQEVQPERKRGKWLEKMRPTQSQKAAICECSVCGDTVWVYDGDRTWNYCPNCGARMEETDERT